ncbi:MAG: S1 family peptidase [Chelatococcus sp.]|nr:S1 family peptidase [Chelatococcus sp. YT9]MBX3559465.1 S1 family peptidase [Chelatococcus sp.]
MHELSAKTRTIARHALALSLLVSALLAGAPSAKAVVGATGDGGSLAAASVMVLGSRGSVCSAVVVAPDAVLTAAHCVTGADAFRVHFRERGEPVLIEPRSIAVHPGYVPNAIRTRQRSIDLALVRLPSPLPVQFSTASLVAAQRSPAPGTSLMLGGWGVAREGDGASSGTFRTAPLAVVEPYGPSSILIWAADRQGLGKSAGAGVCRGDSGGPIALKSGAIIAISTWSKGPGKRDCGLLSQGVLVGPQRAFIDRTLGGWGRRASWVGD